MMVSAFISRYRLRLNSFSRFDEKETVKGVLFLKESEMSGGYPLNLSISLSGKGEINRDTLSSGERTEKS